MIDVDPIEAIVNWLKTALTLAEGRVASKHDYGDGWEVGQLGVTVHADGGVHDLYAAVSNQRLELRIYGAGTVDIANAHKQLKSLSRDNERFVIATTNGNALVHYFYPETGLSLIYDDVLKMDLGVVFFQTEISEEAVS